MLYLLKKLPSLAGSEVVVQHVADPQVPHASVVQERLAHLIAWLPPEHSEVVDLPLPLWRILGNGSLNFGGLALLLRSPLFKAGDGGQRVGELLLLREDDVVDDESASAGIGRGSGALPEGDGLLHFGGRRAHCLLCAVLD